MLLAIDVGNTQTVVGIYQDGSLQYRWRVATNKSHTSDELRVKLVPLLASEGLKLDDVRGVALASVVPALTMAWCAAAYRMIGKDALVCSAETAGSLFEADYPNPHEIGADRVAAQSQTITAINPELTLEGLRLVYEAQEGAASV